MPTARSVVCAATLALLVTAAPGCCGRLDRPDRARSLDYAISTFGVRTQNDARRTARTFSTLHCAFEKDVRTSVRDMSAACELYFADH